MGAIATAMRTTPRTCHRVWQAFEKGGYAALEDARPGRPRIRLSVDQRVRSVQWRRETGYGARRMEALMQAGTPWWPSHWPVVPHNRINDVFREARLLREGRTRGKKPSCIRFEREHSNSLWQADWHWHPTEENWLLAYLDDHSCFITAAGTFDEATTDNALQLFEAAGERFGYPSQVLTDHGTQFTSTNPRGTRHRFETRRSELGVEHIMGQVKKPTTTGKIERFFFTYEDELCRNKPDLATRIWHYNFERIHLSLNYRVPALVYGQGLPHEAPRRDEVLAFLSDQIPSWATGGT